MKDVLLRDLQKLIIRSKKLFLMTFNEPAKVGYNNQNYV